MFVVFLVEPNCNESSKTVGKKDCIGLGTVLLMMMMMTKWIDPKGASHTIITKQN